MASSTQRVEGLDQLLKNMQQLPRELVSKNGGLVRRALLRAARIIRDEAAARAPKDTGNLSKNVIAVRDRNPQATGASERYMITVKKKRYTKNSKANAPKTSKGKINYRAHGDAYYWRWVEFGTGPRVSKKTGKYTGQAPAQPFLRPGFENKKQAALAEFKDNLGKSVAQTVKRMRK